MKWRTGRKWFDFKGGFPRLYLHEKRERAVRFALRGITAIGIAMSVVSLPWYFALATSIGLVIVDTFLERTLFYYTTLYVGGFMEDYDPDQWAATVIVSLGEPEDPESLKIVGLAFRTDDYAIKFFNFLHHLNGLSDDNEQRDLRLTFLIDEDLYYVFLYADFERERVSLFRRAVEKANELIKFGKEHFPLQMEMIICKSFETKHAFALGMFLDTNPPGKPFVLAPYVYDGQQPRAVDGVAPIRMKTYKSKRPDQLTEEDLELIHWRKVIQRGA